MVLTVADLDDATAFERYAIVETLGKSPSGPSSSVLDLTTPGPKSIAVNLSGSLSAGAVSATIDKLKPLLFGAAYKVLDLLLELALNSAGFTPRTSRWSFEEKAKHAGVFDGNVPPLTSTELWHPLCRLYVNLLDLRHALVHRTARIETDGSLTGAADQGGVTSLSRDEQSEFALAVLAATEGVIVGKLSGRTESHVAARLNRLQHVHGEPVIANAGNPEHMPVLVRARLEQVSDGVFRLNRDAVLREARRVFSTATSFDAELIGDDGQGHQRKYACELEGVPDETVEFAADSPPIWLTEVTP